MVLSACNTFVGQGSPGIEVLNLAGAFLAAGADTVVATLWEVDDESTSDFMYAFYQGLLCDSPKQTRAEAFRSAQLSLLHQQRYKAPYFWAPFVVYGDPR